jgi:hypothetical protein
MLEEPIEGWVALPLGDRPSFIPKSRFETFPELKVLGSSDGDWSIKNMEEYSHTQKPRVEIFLLAEGKTITRNGIAQLSRLSPLEEVTSSQELERFAELLERNLRLMEGPEPIWSAFVRKLRLCLDSQLESTVLGIVAEANDRDLFWLAICSPTLGARLATMRALFAHKYTNEAITATDFSGFEAANALMLNSIGSFTLYFHPFFLINAPKVGGYATNRVNVTFIYQPETEIQDQPNTWTDALEIFKPHYAGSGTLSARTSSNFDIDSRNICLNWWTTRISDVLWRISSLNRFADKSNTYSASKHLGAVLTLERIFITAVEIMRLKSKDDVIRKNLLFELLDLLEGNGMGTYEVNLSVKRQKDIWETIKSELPTELVNMITSHISGAFEALEALDADFWIPAARTKGGNIWIEKKSGLGKEEIAIDRARGEYLRVLRNSHHGFSVIAHNPRSLSYLANHRGSLDDRLPDLALWYLIRILHNPKWLVP